MQKTGGVARRISAIEINGSSYPVKIYRERRRDARATLRTRTIHIRIPANISEKRAAAIIDDLLAGLSKKIIDRPPPEPESPEPLRDGDILKIDKEEFLLRIYETDRKLSSAEIVFPCEIHIRLASGLSERDKSNHLSDLTAKCVAKYKLPEIQSLAAELNEKHFGFPLRTTRLKNNRSRWGSCSKKGNVNLSTRLLLAPREILEYVIIHELAHLEQMNHSPKFWALVERADPDYRSKILWLKKNGGNLRFYSKA